MKMFVPPLPSDEPLMKQALDALRIYHEAVEAGAPAKLIEQYKIEAEVLFQTVSEYYQRSMGGHCGSLH